MIYIENLTRMKLDQLQNYNPYGRICVRADMTNQKAKIY